MYEPPACRSSILARGSPWVLRESPAARARSSRGRFRRRIPSQMLRDQFSNWASSVCMSGKAWLPRALLGGIPAECWGLEGQAVARRAGSRCGGSAPMWSVLQGGLAASSRARQGMDICSLHVIAHWSSDFTLSTAIDLKVRADRLTDFVTEIGRVCSVE